MSHGDAQIAPRFADRADLETLRLAHDTEQTLNRMRPCAIGQATLDIEIVDPQFQNWLDRARIDPEHGAGGELVLDERDPHLERDLIHKLLIVPHGSVIVCHHRGCRREKAKSLVLIELGHQFRIDQRRKKLLAQAVAIGPMDRFLAMDLAYCAIAEMENTLHGQEERAHVATAIVDEFDDRRWHVGRNSLREVDIRDCHVDVDIIQRGM